MKIDLNLTDKYRTPLKVIGLPTINKTSILTFQSGKQNSQSEAIGNVNRLRTALLFTSMRNFFGIKTSNYYEYVEYGKYNPKIIDGREHYESENKDELGTFIFEKEIPKRPGLSGVSLTNGLNPKLFFKFISLAFQECEKINKKQLLALELVNLSHFESKIETSFITLVTAVEVLSKREVRNKDSIDLVNKFLQEINDSNLSNVSKDSIRGSLKNLKKISIGQACFNLVEEQLGNDKALKFKKLYSLRCELVHEGKIDKEIDLVEEYYSLQRIVINLLNKEIFGRDIFK